VRFGKARADRYERAYRARVPVRGRAVAATGAGVAIDLPPGIPAFVRRGDMAASTRADPAALIGSAVEGLVIALPPARKTVLVSPRHLGVDRCRAVVGRRRLVPIKVTGANRGGVIVDVHGVPGFMPRSEMRPADALRHTELVGQTVRGYVIRVSGQQAVVSAYPPRVRRRRGAPPGGYAPPNPDQPSRSAASRSPSASSSEPSTSRAVAIFTMLLKLGLRSPRSIPPTYVR
jgi:ribosomal protein S1